MKPKTLKRLLETPFWPEGLTTRKVYTRLHDDHDGDFQGRISVYVTEDGDAWLSADRAHQYMRFRTFGGGGMSLRVRNALVILAEAIRLDNEEIPQHAIQPERTTQP